MKKILLTVVMAVALCFSVSGASANGIVLNGTVNYFGTGFGNVSNILTLHNNDPEKGSILWNGASDALTGDASNTSKTWLFSDIVGKGITDASQFGIVYNVNQQGNLGDTTLNSFTLQVYGPSGGVPVFETIGCPDCGPGFDPIENGTGGAGYLFVLDLEAQGFLAPYFTNPDSFRLGATGDISFSNGGPENFFFVKLSEATKVPEPGTFLLLGVGLIGLAGAGRRRFKNR